MKRRERIVRNEDVVKSKVVKIEAHDGCIVVKGIDGSYAKIYLRQLHNVIQKRTFKQLVDYDE